MLKQYFFRVCAQLGLLVLMHCAVGQRSIQELPASFAKLVLTNPESCIIQGLPEYKSIALTFDDGPSELTIRILDLLAEHDIKGTFFWQGQHLTKYHSVAMRTMQAGHELANHSWDHPNGIDRSPEKLWKEQVDPTLQLFDSLLGVKVNLFRPPFGAITEEQVAYLGGHGVTSVLWSLSTYDWDLERNSSDEIFASFSEGLHAGAIVLMHDMDFGNTSTDKLDALERMIVFAKSEGYTFLTVTELRNLKR